LLLKREKHSACNKKKKNKIPSLETKNELTTVKRGDKERQEFKKKGQAMSAEDKKVN